MQAGLTLCMLGNFSCFCCGLLIFSKLSFAKKSFRNTIREPNGFGSRSGPTKCLSCSGSKLFAYYVISRRQKSLLASKELISLFLASHVWVINQVRHNSACTATGTSFGCCMYMYLWAFMCIFRV